MNVKYFNLQYHIGAVLITHVTTLSHNQLNLYQMTPVDQGMISNNLV